MNSEISKMNGVFINSIDIQDKILNNEIKDNLYIKKRAGFKKPTKIAYLGGSVSAGKFPWHMGLKEFLKTEEEKNFSIGGVGAFFSIFNLNNILNYNPDVVFVDFTVNEICSKTYIILETFGRILSFLISRNIDCCLIHNYHISFQNNFNDKKTPNTILILEQLADQLNIPSINFAQYFGDLLRENKIKNENFLSDSCHLNQEAKSYISFLYESQNIKNLIKKEEFDKQSFLMDYKDIHISYHHPNALCETNKTDNIDPRPGLLIKKFLESKDFKINAYIWQENQEFTLEFYGRWLFIHDLMGPHCGKIFIRINNNTEFSVSRFDSYCSEHFRHHFVAIDCNENNHHKVSFKLLKEDQKIQILDKRQKTLKVPEDLNITINYIFQICSM